MLEKLSKWWMRDGTRAFRDNVQVRAFFRPVMDVKKRRLHERYLRSPDSWYLKTLKGIHAGKRCFIIGNGPSLCGEDLNKLKGEYTFAVNRIYEIFDQTDWRPTYYVAADPKFLETNFEELKNNELGHMFLVAGEKVRLDYPIQKMTRIFVSSDYYFDPYQNRYNMWSACISTDISQVIFTAGTVVFATLQLALYMGFAEIYLLGIDFSYAVTRDAEGSIHVYENVKDYFNGRRYNSELNYETVLHIYRITKEYCENHGIVLKNATRGGKLEVFERVDFDSLFL